MTGIQNIIHRLKQGEIIEIQSDVYTFCFQYNVENNAFIAYDENKKVFALDEIEIENLIRNHIEGKDQMN